MTNKYQKSSHVTTWNCLKIQGSSLPQQTNNKDNTISHK
uniref:Uncharacterized protein n=1 Tax=Rhizophora mucronata TaxID=61149 RepID=A0A2P2P2M0_RHIMU